MQLYHVIVVTQMYISNIYFKCSYPIELEESVEKRLMEVHL